METLKIEYLGNYANHGQDAEQSFRFAVTGQLEKADNLHHSLGGDCLDMQIKSARATVCKGLDLKAYLDLDGAKRFVYVTNDGTAYIMSRTEYELFCTEFATPTTESVKNGGQPKLRLKSESKALLEWLASRV
jgi:hypothetical protein